ncbi:MAG: thiolase family protein [Alphaproteobacteria bacterium]|nr:thiolase family protein [Alphaproteobacteria bacterium]
MVASPDDIVLAGGMRSPFGDFGRSLKDVPASDLAVHAARAALDRVGLTPGRIDHLVLGNTLPVDQDGLFGGRVVALKLGMPEDSCAMNVARACGTGLQAIVSAGQQLQSGHSRVALAGGVENYSRAPFVVTSARWGHARGPQVMTDMLDYCYRDPFNGEYMGETAENLADEFGYDRDAMDEWALMSQRRAGQGQASGFLARQIAPISVPDGRGVKVFDMDEFPRPNITPERLAGLKPAFRKDGRVTAGNSSGVTDGAAFMVMTTRDEARRHDIEPLVRLVDWAVVGVPPRIMGIGPVPAIAKLFERTGLEVDDIDYFEINEAFAAVNLHAERMLKIPRDRTNLYGGGISIGHPPGATGVRMALTAIEHLRETGGRRAVLSMCLGAGQGMAVLIERT